MPLCDACGEPYQTFLREHPGRAAGPLGGYGGRFECPACGFSIWVFDWLEARNMPRRANNVLDPVDDQRRLTWTHRW